MLLGCCIYEFDVFILWILEDCIYSLTKKDLATKEMVTKEYTGVTAQVDDGGKKVTYVADEPINIVNVELEASEIVSVQVTIKTVNGKETEYVSKSFFKSVCMVSQALEKHKWIVSMFLSPKALYFPVLAC